ncbi:MAG: SLAP domain-containing protein [Bacteroidaceae bacterium]|nr:SLAP domain-containing protein [Bacteroidaceae bacterium]
MRRHIILIIALLCTIGMRAQRISYIETTRSWYYVYDEDGKRIRSFSTSQGRLVTYTSSFYIIRQGNSYYIIYDASGKRITSLGVNVVGEILSASGDTFTSRNASWIYTWTKEGKRISSRSANTKM